MTKARITTSATTKDTTEPMAIWVQPTCPVPAASSWRWSHSRLAVAPNLRGTASQKLNSPAVVRSLPLASAPLVFVLGGGQRYAKALPQADDLVLTEVDADLDGDAFFPPWERHAFAEVSREPHRAAERTGFAFVHYRRL